MKSIKTKKQKNISVLTYCIRSEYYSPSFIKTIFTAAKGWKSLTDTELDIYIKTGKRVDFVYVDGIYRTDPRFMNVKARLKNIVDNKKREITQKNNLFRNLAKVPNMAGFLMQQLDIDLLDSVKASDYLTNHVKPWMMPDKIYIFKPVSEFAGRGIKVITDFSELVAYCKKVITKYNQYWKTSNPAAKMRQWVLQEYIMDPLLYNNRKFHVRHYLFYRPGGKGNRCFYLKSGELAPARKAYKANNWTDTAIHDTHFYGKDGPLFPKNLKLSMTTLANIYAQLAQLYKGIFSIIKAECYPESLDCYELFGVDFMITRDYQVKLIEINEKIGMPSIKSPMTKELFKAIQSIALNSK
jgi:hypothetical protein